MGTVHKIAIVGFAPADALTLITHFRRTLGAEAGYEVVANPHLADLVLVDGANSKVLRELKALPEDLVRDAVMVKLQMVGLDPAHAHKMPADLSGGMIKRVALARALIMDPPLLLLDEPTAGLDPDRSDAFCALVRSLHQELGLTVVMVTHDLDTIYEISTRVAVVAEKHVIVNAPPREVIGFDHPFVRNFFLGGRGLRAMELLRLHPTEV